MNLDYFESSGQRAFGGAREIFHYRLDFRDRQSAWRGVICRKANGARRDRLPRSVRCWQSLAASPRHVRASFASRMRELHPGYGAMLSNKLRDWPPGIDVCVPINSGVGWRNPASLFDCSSFRENQSSAAYSAAAEMHQMPGLRMPFHCGIFAHRRNHNAVLQLQFSQPDRTEQFHSMFSSRLLDAAGERGFQTMRCLRALRLSLLRSLFRSRETCPWTIPAAFCQ